MKKFKFILLILICACLLWVVGRQVLSSPQTSASPRSSSLVGQASCIQEPVSPQNEQTPLQNTVDSASPEKQENDINFVAGMIPISFPERGQVCVDNLDPSLILDQRITEVMQGVVERVSLVNGGGSYPYHRIEELLRYDSEEGQYIVASQRMMVADHFLVKLQPGESRERLEAFNEQLNAKIMMETAFVDKYMVQLPKPSLDGVPEALATYQKEAGWIERVHADGIYAPTATPNDTDWSSQWDKQKIDCPEAWDSETGSTNIIIAIIDTGVDLDHPDLEMHLWRNPGEAGAKASNGVDDDGNGHIDDWIGWDFGQNDNDPDDNGDSDKGGDFSESGHGTHCAGIAGAIGNNSTHIAGVCWNVTIMALKPFEYMSGYGEMRVYSSKAESAMRYATDNGAKITSNSYGGEGYESEYYDGVNYQKTHGVLFIAAAGNKGTDNDSTPYYPCNINLPNVISVASSTSSETLSSFSNYGSTTVDIVAPGSSIRSTVSGGGTATYNGTSMAAPQVAGAAALLYSAKPSLSYLDCKQALLDGVDTFSAYSGKCVSGGRLNVSHSLNLLTTIAMNETNIVLTAVIGGADTVSRVISNAGSGELTFSLSDDNVAGVYSWRDSDGVGGPTYEWIDISASGTEVHLTDDGVSALFNIGFNFPFYGESETQFQMGGNGVVSLSAGGVNNVNRVLPHEAIPSQSFCLFWDDLNPSDGGSFFYETQSNRLVVSYIGVPIYGTSDLLTFQLVLHSDGRIFYQYKTLNGNLTSCTIGIMDDHFTGPSVQVVHSAAYLKNNLAIEFLPPQPRWISYSPSSETVGADEVFFEGDPINIKDLYNEKSGILDEEDDIDVDLASYAYQIWKNAVDLDPNLTKIIPDLPDVIFATKKAAEEQTINGAIVYTKTANENDVLAWINENGEIETQSQFEILKTVNCTPDEPAMERFEKHHELVKIGIDHIKETEEKVGGQLGKKSGARYRVYMRLTNYAERSEGTIWVTEELKRTIDDIYKYPLREYARETINRQLKTGINDEDLVNLVIALREEGKLSLISEEETDYKEPRIICSMGLRVK